MTRALTDDIVHALHRVPGVLLADLNPASGRVVVAHDGAVELTALVSAATRTGASATIVRERVSAPPAASLAPARAWQLVIVIIVSTAAIVLIDLLLPASLPKRVVLNGLILGAWVCFFASTFARRRP
jgi:hypothetical protein